jgi:hypothetical protein
MRGGSIEPTGGNVILTVTSDSVWGNATFKPRVQAQQDGISDIWLTNSLLFPNNKTPIIAAITQSSPPSINTAYRWSVVVINGTLTTNGISPTLSNGTGPAYQRYSSGSSPTYWKLGLP